MSRGRWATVGEQGPELRRFPRGTRVLSNQQTRDAVRPREMTAAQVEQLTSWCERITAAVGRHDLRETCILALADMGAGFNVIRCSPCIERLEAAGAGAAAMARHPSVTRLYFTSIVEHVRNRPTGPHVFEINHEFVRVAQ